MQNLSQSSSGKRESQPSQPAHSIWRRIFQFFLPPINEDLTIGVGLSVVLVQGLERILTALLRSAALLAVLALVAISSNVVRNQRWDIFLIYIVIISILWFVAANRNLNYRFRAGYFVFIAYGLGVTDLIFFGIAEDGRIYLFCFAVFTTLFLDKRAAIWATLLSVLTFGASGMLWHWGYLNTDISILADSRPSLEAVIILSLTLLMTSGLATAAMAAVVREFESAWERERQANILVQQERDTLEMRVEERTEELSERNSELSQTLSNLKNTQRQLIEAEKMAALGGLVAGVAHEINTPIGIGVTAASTLADETKLFLNDYQNGQIKRSALSHYLDIATDSSRLILRNLERAAELVQSFKQVAVDQTNLEQREFAVIGYIQEVLRSLHPQIKRFNHHIEVRGDETITLNSYPGAFSQVVTNLVMNSLVHAYPDGKPGKLRFEVTDQAGIITVGYQDDGCGISQENLPRIFEPFYTTARNRGGTGLGLHIVYNLVTQKLGGQIRCESQVGLGTSFVLLFPKT